MSELNTTNQVPELLKPITGDAPTGAPIEAGTNVNYYTLDAMLEGNGKIDYELGLEKAGEILQSESKHLEIAAWLTMFWLKLDGTTGFKNGLFLIVEYLNQFSDKMHPPEPEGRRRAVEFLSKDRRVVALLKKAIANNGNMETLTEIQQLLVMLKTQCEKIADQAPDLSTVADMVAEKTGKSMENGSVAAESEKADAADDLAEKDAAALKETEAEEPADEATEASEEDASKDKAEVAKTDETVQPAEENAETPTEEPAEPDFELPEQVEDLLEDIDRMLPAGEDVENTSDMTAFALFNELSAEISKHNHNDYEACIQHSETILKDYSKHVQVVIWLTISWYRNKGITGLKHGLILLVELLKKYGNNLHPKRKKGTLEQLNRESRFQALKRMTFGDESATYEVTDDALKTAKDQLDRDIYNKLARLRDRKIGSKAAFLKQFEETLSQEPASEQKKLVDKFKQQEKDLLKFFQAAKRGSEKLHYELTPFSIYLMKKHGVPATVTSVLASDDFMEVSYQSQARFLDMLVGDFEDQEIFKLYKPVMLAFANQKFIGMLEIEHTFGELESVCNNLFEAVEARPAFTGFGSIIREQANRARTGLDKALKEVKSGKGAAEKKRREAEKEKERKRREAARKKEKETEKKSTGREQSAGSEGKEETHGTTTIRQVKIKDDADAGTAFEKGLVYFFEALDENGEAKRKVAEKAYVYGISRQTRWGGLGVLPQNNAVEGPNEPRQNYLKKLFESNDFDNLIGVIEAEFIKNNAFRFWLDAQRYSAMALTEKGGFYEDAALEIKIHLARLIDRFPELTKLTFRDGKTRFASEATIEWIEEEVKGCFGAGGKEKIVPPIVGEDFAPINAMYEKACEALPEKFEENARAMQVELKGETRRKGRFLRRVNLANFCYLANKYDLARIFFNELIEKINRYKLSDWEDALCVHVWRDTYRNNQQLLAQELHKQDQTDIEAQQRYLIEQITKFDIMLAKELQNSDPNKGG